MKKLLLLSIIFCYATMSYGQSINYDDLILTLNKKPAYPQYDSYTTFDMAAVTTLDETEVNMNLPYKIKLANFKQVPVSNDFHIVTCLQRSSGKFTADNTISLNVLIASNIYDRFGNIITSVYIDEPARIVTFDRALTKEERNNKDFTRQLIVEKLTEVLMTNFLNRLKGETVEIPYELAGLGSVKKMPELIDFSKTIKEVKTRMEMAALKTTLEPHVPYWEKMSHYAGEGDSIDVRRAAYQNLAIYNIVAGNNEAANAVIENYKAIDKVHKTMFGLVKTFHSDNCEKMIAKLNNTATVVDETAAVVTLQQLKDGYKYFTLNGTITVDAKKIGGTYKGQLQVDKIPSTGGGGGIMNLDATAANVVITTKDEAGAVKVIKTDLSNITSFVDDKGVEYAITKYGSGALGGAYYCILKPTYTSAKITVFRAVVPATTDYVIKKKGDDKGIKSTTLNSKKIMVEYLSDCETLATKFKEVAATKAETPEKLAEQYSNCAVAK
jgi:hypothetical protein